MYLLLPSPWGAAAPQTPSLKSISNTCRRLVTISIEAPHSRYRDECPGTKRRISTDHSRAATGLHATALWRQRRSRFKLLHQGNSTRRYLDSEGVATSDTRNNVVKMPVKLLLAPLLCKVRRCIVNLFVRELLEGRAGKPGRRQLNSDGVKDPPCSRQAMAPQCLATCACIQQLLIKRYLRAKTNTTP